MPRVAVVGEDNTALGDRWVAMATPAGRYATPQEIAAEDWDARPDDGDRDAADWWFRTTFTAARAQGAGETILVFEGLATLAEVYLGGTLILESESMFEHAAVEVGALIAAENELVICCRAIEPRLREARRPRARWRTRVVRDGNLRFLRTMIMGRAPGFAPGPPLVGPWRPVRLLTRRELAVDALELRVRTDVAGARGHVALRAVLRLLDGNPISRVVAVVGDGADAATAELDVVRDGAGAHEASGELELAAPALWWPHTHGAPARHPVALEVTGPGGTTRVDAGQVGFRELAGPQSLERDGLSLTVNGVPVFVRGAVWTPPELTPAGGSDAELRRSLGRLLDAGMNMVRIPGTGAYESARFHDLCDELGVLVWQDFMFANLDYPEADAAFMARVEAEARQVLADLGGRPSLAVLCGSSEVAQQVAMLGLDPGLAEGPLFGRLLPGIVREAGIDAVYVPSAPWGGDLPIRPDRGVANYYGVGGYRRPIEDARRSGVRFASECLAFGNVPDDGALEGIAARCGGQAVVHHPAWKAGVPRDVGTGWDFDDVRDHYLTALFGVDAGGLRAVDPARYLELSRAVSGEAMSAVFGEWRRRGSDCAGALVLWWRDLREGAGWGLLDDRGERKAAYFHLRRILAPVAVWTTDEGLGGLGVHVANDGPDALEATLRLALYRDRETRVEECAAALSLAPHDSLETSAETLLGRFVDVSWAYRLGPPGHDLVALSLERPGAGAPELLAQAFRLPPGSLPAPETARALGLEAALSADRATLGLTVRSRRFAHGVRVAADGYAPDDDCFSIEPGGERRITLVADGAGDAKPVVIVTALNLLGHVRVEEAGR